MNPRLREGLVIRKVAEGDDVAFTVCDSARDKYYRIDHYTHLVATHLDGRRSLAEVSRLCQQAMPYTDFSVPVVEEAVQDLDAIGLLEDPYRKNVLLLERARTNRPQIAEFFRNMLLWHVGVWDPDKFLDRTIDRVRWVFHPALAWAATLGLVWNVWLVFVNRNELNFEPGHLMGLDSGENVVQGLLVLLAILLFVGAVHEFGHAYACKHFGGEVHRMGFMLMYFSPCFFVDVSHSMLLENRWHRIWVAMGGIYFESFITIAAAVLWWVSPPELYVHDLSYRVMMTGLLLGLVVNLNPLLKFDGYFVLSDLLQISELREKALRYVRDLVRRPFRRRADTEERVVGTRRRRAYIAYGLFTFGYSYIVVVCFFQWLRGTLVGAWAETGFVLFACMVGLFVRKPVVGALKHTAGWVRRPSPTILRVGIAVLVLGVIAHFVRTPAYVLSEARYMSSEREAVRAEEPGRVAAVLVRAGDRVLPRQVVAILENDSLQSALEAARARSEETAIEAADAMERSNPAAYRSASLLRGAAQAEEGGWRGAKSRLALATRLGGVVVTPRVSDRIGERLEPGDTLLVIASQDGYEIECDLTQGEVGDVDPGSRFTVRLRSDPGREVAGRITRVLPVPSVEAGAPVRFRAWGGLDGPVPGAMLGSTGTARIEIGRLNVYERMARLWARYVRADFWL